MHVSSRLKNPVELLCAITLKGALSAAIEAKLTGLPGVDNILPVILEDSQTHVSHAAFSVPTEHVIPQSV